MNVKGIFTALARFFTSDKAKAFQRAVEQAVVDAAPIVATISALVPNRNFQTIATAYSKYAVPFAMTELQLTDPVQQGLALRDLATAVLRKNHADLSANALNAAVELAVGATAK